MYAFEELVEEVYDTKASTLMIRNGDLLRHLQIIRVWLTTEILSVPMNLTTLSKVHVLFSSCHLQHILHGFLCMFCSHLDGRISD